MEDKIKLVDYSSTAVAQLGGNEKHEYKIM